MSDTVYKVVRGPNTPKEGNDFRDFGRLMEIKRSKVLSKSEAKQLNRVTVRLQKAGIINPVSREVLKLQAAAIYRAMPWWKKFHMKLRFWWGGVKLWWVSKP